MSQAEAGGRAGRFDAVLFDNDGTLVDTYELIYASFRHCVREVLGCELSEERLMGNQGRPLDEQMKELSDEPAVQKALAESYRSYNHAHHDAEIRSFPGIAEGLEELRRAGLVLGVVTSKSHWLARQGLEVLGLWPAFSLLVGQDDTERHKPDPQPLLHAARELGLRPERCLYVGDSPYDLQAGRRAGMATAAVCWGSFSRSRLEAEAPDLVCEGFSELIGFVLA